MLIATPVMPELGEKKSDGTELFPHGEAKRAVAG